MMHSPIPPDHKPGEPIVFGVSNSGTYVVPSLRPATREAEDRYLLSAYRGALERIATTLRMPGSPSLVEDVPTAVELLVWTSRTPKPVGAVR